MIVVNGQMDEQITKINLQRHVLRTNANQHFGVFAASGL